jgi:DNA mismatch endonuclease, patch repair protein
MAATPEATADTADQLPRYFQGVSDATRRSMRSNRRRDTKPEIAVRRTLHASGLRFNVDRRILTPTGAARPDIVFPRVRVAVFIDGCFWHGCAVHGTVPKNNRDLWAPKLARNRERDAEQTRSLRGDGWIVVRFWEHQSHEEIAVSVRALVLKRAHRPCAVLPPT